MISEVLGLTGRHAGLLARREDRQAGFKASAIIMRPGAVNNQAQPAAGAALQLRLAWFDGGAMPLELAAQILDHLRMLPGHVESFAWIVLEVEQ